MSDFKGRHFGGEIVLWAIRWYCRYPISYRDLKTMMTERGVAVDHSTIYRWVQHFAPEMEKRLRWQWRRPQSRGWRIDETYVKVRGKWAYLYRAVDKLGNTIDFYLSSTRNTKAAKRFLGKTLRGLKEWEQPEVHLQCRSGHSSRRGRVHHRNGRRRHGPARMPAHLRGGGAARAPPCLRLARPSERRRATCGGPPYALRRFPRQFFLCQRGRPV